MAIDQYTDERLWQEWLAFTPFAMLSGAKAVNFDEFKRTKPKKREKAPMSAIDAIRKHFNLS